MNQATIYKFLDFAIFAVLIYLAYHYYYLYVSAPNPNITDAIKFDAVNIAALLYVIFRKPDINTVSLALIILVGRVLDTFIFYGVVQLNNFVLFTVLFSFNLFGVLLIWFRPLVVTRVYNDHDDLAVTDQDNVLGLLLLAQAVFQLLCLIEHGTRRINQWWYENARLLYNNYELIQFVFAIGGIAILYFMTFDASKIKRANRKKFRIQDGKQ